MKFFFVTLYIFFFTPSFSQADSIITYTGVVTVETATKDDLYTRARQWFNDTWTSSNEVLRISDKETGELSGKGYIRVPLKYKMLGKRETNNSCRLFLSIWVKDGRYKYSFSNFQVDIGGTISNYLSVLTNTDKCPDKISMVSQKKMDEIWQSAKDAVEVKIQEMIAELNKRMMKKADNDF